MVMLFGGVQCCAVSGGDDVCSAGQRESQTQGEGGTGELPSSHTLKPHLQLKVHQPTCGIRLTLQRPPPA